MGTPEGKVKAKLREILSEFPGLYTYWPVPSGFGRTNLDVIGCYRGRFFCVETKREGGKPTLRQHQELERMARAMGKTFVIAGLESPVFDELIAWLGIITGTVRDDTYIPPDPVNRRIV